MSSLESFNSSEYDTQDENLSEEMNSDWEPEDDVEGDPDWTPPSWDESSSDSSYDCPTCE